MLIHPSVREALQPVLPGAMAIARRHGLPSDYQAGHRPRHMAGNLSDPQTVRLVVLLAEPGSSPGPEEMGRSERTWLEDVTCDGVGGGGFRLRYDGRGVGAHESLYERNPCAFLGAVWPELSAAERLRRAVITNAFWVQAPTSGGSIPSGAEAEFGPILRRLLGPFSNAVIVAAGNKAQRRCAKAGVSFVPMGALTPPGCNQVRVRRSWDDAALTVRKALGSV